MKKYSLIFIALISIIVISCKSETKLVDMEGRIATWIDKMKSTPEWLAEEERKALEQGVLLDSVLRKDAIWMIQKEDGIIPAEPESQQQSAEPVNSENEAMDSDTVK
jgi:hypothetical protein